jgi:hypothetical protein
MEITEAEALVRDLLSSNKGAGYGLTVTSLAADLQTINIEVRFLAGKTYCCHEFGCHFPQYSDALIRLSPEFPPNLIVRWHYCVERGATFAVPDRRVAFYESEALDYHHVTTCRTNA